MNTVEHSDFMNEHFPRLHVDDGSIDLAPANVPLVATIVTHNNCKRLGLKFEEIFKLNSSGLRSNEFTKDHKGKTHILFAGCSVTFGDGLPVEHSWANKTYRYLSDSLGDTSGYFNIATPGMSILSISMQILKYVSMYGTPNVLFIMVPDVDREMLIEFDSQRMQGLALQLYRLMVKDLESKGCRIMVMSWEAEINREYINKKTLRANDPRLQMGSNFFRFDVEERQKALYSMDKKDKSLLGVYKEFGLEAMDGHHPGIFEHDFYYKFAIDIFEGNISSSGPPSINAV